MADVNRSVQGSGWLFGLPVYLDPTRSVDDGVLVVQMPTTRNWVDRGHIEKRGKDRTGRYPTYRLGDIAAVQQRIRFGQQPAQAKEAS